MSSLFNLPWQQVFDSSGNTLAGAKLYFYIAGTSTPKNVYSDIGLGVALSNPVVANGAGRFPPIYMDNEAYKVVLKNEKDELIWTADNVYAQSIDADAAFALAAIKGLTVSAGYTQEQAEEIANFARAVYKYANASTWYSETGNEDNKYILEGFDDYTRPADYFEGFEAEFYCSRPNTGAATVNIENLGAKNIYHADGSALNAGDIQGLVHLRFNGTSFAVVPSQVDQYGNQTIYNTKTFDESPLVPTPATSDNSTKAASTAYVKNNFSLLTGLPKWNSAISTTASTYTVPSRGWLFVEMAGSSEDSTVGYAYINNKEVGYILSKYGRSVGDSSIFIPVNTGDVLTFSGNINTGLQKIFYPAN